MTQRHPAYGSSPIRRHRRTKAEMAVIRRGLYEIVAEGQPMTVRQIFYQAVSRGLVEKTEAEYTGTVGRLLTEMRMAHHFMDRTGGLDGRARARVRVLRGSPDPDRKRLKAAGWPEDLDAMKEFIRREQGAVPFSWIADNTRWMRVPKTWDSVESALHHTAETYRRQLWENQDAYVEVWLEKEALAGVVVDITAEWDVPLMVTRGYPSVSFVHSASKTIAEVGKPAHIYYLGDHDPSGVDIPRNVEQRLREFAPGAEIQSR
jgi:hypothetical protein